jgi:hypothetical protein
VWTAAVELASGGLRGWSLVSADEDRGLLSAESRTLVLRFVDDVQVSVTLDENAQTRVDVASSSRKGRGDLGQNARRIRAFFRTLDRRVGAGPGTILDPTLSLFRNGLLLLTLALALAGVAGCTPSREPAPDTGSQEEAARAPDRNFHGRSYERNLVFLATGSDSTLIVPWLFAARTWPGGVDRRVQGWLARSETWDRFMDDIWEAPPTRVPWRILPRGPTRLILGLDEALERVVYREGPRHLEVAFGALLVEWTGPRAQTFRIQEGAARLSELRMDGLVLDMSRAWTAEDEPPGGWGFLVSGDSLQVVMEDASSGSGPEGGRWSLWTRVGLEELRWDGVQLVWSERLAYEAARRDVPGAWLIRDPGREISGSLASAASFLAAGEGEGPLLPVEGLYQVTGVLALAGRSYPVRGLIRHLQR